jgi:hypothetical protein
MPPEVRTQLLENDVDSLEDAIDRLAGKLESIYKVLVTMLISITTTAILLVLNLVAGA